MSKPASKKWLSQAKQDLDWTRANLREKIWYGACFTAQQAAEKSLKAYLISKGKSIFKTHDLGALVTISKKYDPEFEQIKEDCAILTNYYSPARYPDTAEFMIFSKSKAEEALRLAREVFEFVERRI